MDFPTPAEEAAVRRTTVTWAAALAQDIDRIREAESKRLQEEAEATEKQRQKAVADLEARVAELNTNLAKIPQPAPQDQKPSDPAEAGGFVLGGLVLHAGLHVAVPSLKLRLIDDKDKTVLDKPGWTVDDVGRYRLELGAGEVQQLRGLNLRLELLDPLGARVKVMDSIPRIDIGCAERLDVVVPKDENRLVESIAIHGAATKETLERSKVSITERISALNLRKAQVGLDLARNSEEITDRKHSLTDGGGTLIRSLVNLRL